MNLQRCINRLIANLPSEHAIISPGSRNAPVVFALEHAALSCHSVIDERSAGFVALGIAKHTRTPVILSCTSGTAALNYYPAIAEAFYARIPLIILTADRPPEQIDAWDGQAIRQNGVFSNHVRGQFTAPDEYDDESIFEHIGKQVQQLIAADVPGPIHVNIPIREPFYNFTTEGLERVKVAAFQHKKYEFSLNAIAKHTGADFKQKKVLVFNGMAESDGVSIKGNESNVILSDVTANQADNVPYWDAMLFAAQTKANGLKELAVLKPDILITTGNTTVSKGLKRFLFHHPPQVHYHFSAYKEVGLMFKTSPIVIHPEDLNVLGHEVQYTDNPESSYRETWLEMTSDFKKRFSLLDWSSYNEFTAVNYVLNELPETALLHIGNSMPIRYTSFLMNSYVNRNIIYCNRGTSGIDGSSSTAVGNAIVTDKEVYLLTGDVSFFYDINAWFNTDLPKNLKIVVLNNESGGIFNMISGPDRMQGAIKYQTTPHRFNAKNVAKHFGLTYLEATDIRTLTLSFEQLKRQTGATILEVFTNEKENRSFFDEFKKL